MAQSEFHHILPLFGLPVLAYLLGSIPWGLVLTRMFTSVDIRKQGSGNIGTTNVSRVAGSALGMLTFAGDILKGAVPAFLALILIDASNGPAESYLSLVALAAFFGHLYPVFMKFKGGGKGVATTAGCFVVLSPLACMIALLAFVLLLFSSRHVSVGSLAAATVLPLAVWFFSDSIALAAGAGVMAVFIFIRHVDNIKRLISGSEPVFRQRR